MVELATLLADLSELTSARQMYRQLLDRRWRELTFARQLPQQVLRMWAWVLGMR